MMDDEEARIQALVETPALDWRSPLPLGGPRGSRRSVPPALMTPPEGYVCHRCGVAGHLIQHCPTNGDPAFDVKKVRPPTGIPKSMLLTAPDGSLLLPTGEAAVLNPDEAAFDKAMEGVPSSARPAAEIPPELRCPLCKDVMKDAMMTSKCCFGSYCDGCIRGFLISKSKCVCGATDTMADDLIPNEALRGAIKRILESSSDITGSSSNTGITSVFLVDDLQSAAAPSSSPARPDGDQGESNTGSAKADEQSESNSSSAKADDTAVPNKEKRIIIGCDEEQEKKKMKKRRKMELVGNNNGSEMQWDYGYMDAYAMQCGAYNGYMNMNMNMNMGQQQQYMMMPSNYYMGYNCYYNTPGGAPFGVPNNYMSPALRWDLSQLATAEDNRSSVSHGSKPGVMSEREQCRDKQRMVRESNSCATSVVSPLQSKHRAVPSTTLAATEVIASQDERRHRSDKRARHDRDCTADDGARHSPPNPISGDRHGASSRRWNTPVQEPEREQRASSRWHNRDDQRRISSGEWKRSKAYHGENSGKEEHQRNRGRDDGRRHRI